MLQLLALARAGNAQRIELEGTPLKVTAIQGQPLGVIQYVATNSAGLAAVLGGPTRQQVSFIDESGHSPVPPITMSGIGAPLAWPTSATFDGPTRLVLLDGQSPRIAWVSMRQGKAVLSDTATSNLSSLKSICTITGRHYVLGHGPGSKESGLVHELTPRAIAMRSIRLPFGDGSNPAYFFGRVLCLPSEATVVAVSMLLPDLRAYSASGAKKWSVTLPQFEPMGIVQEGRMFRYTLEANSVWDQTVSLFSPAPNIIAVQAGRMRGRRDSAPFLELRTTFVDARSGAILGQQLGLPIVLAASRSKLFALAKRHDETLVIQEFKYVAR